MEVDFFSSLVSEEDTVEADVEYDNFGIEGERCGICMQVVIDQGVLDCCQHWFCFECIDNWATITNLCPLCQNEFHLITCVPVHDPLGSIEIDEDSDSRDADSCAEGKNNSLSFPSYYIDENAVTCLDGDGCRIRGASVTYEETLTRDTSIACDSCDIWYHAFCVGFDPEGTDVDSWLCPRCLVNQAHPKSDFNVMYHSGKNLDDTSSGEVSVAGAGETAIGVSRIDGEDDVKEPINYFLSNREFNRHGTKQSMLGHGSCSSELKKPLDQGINFIQPEKTIPPSKIGEAVIKSDPDESESRICVHLLLSLASASSERDKANILDGDECLHDASADQSLEGVNPDLAPKLGEKRKRAKHRRYLNPQQNTS